MALAGELQLAVRPDFGTEGSVALARTNCYKMSLDRQLEFVQYDVILRRRDGKVAYEYEVPLPASSLVQKMQEKVEVKGSNRRREIFSKLINELRPDIFQPHKVMFDGQKGMFSSAMLNLQSDKREFEVTMQHSGPTYRVILTIGPTFRSGDLQAFCRGEKHGPDASIMRQILNLLLHYARPIEFRKVVPRTTVFSRHEARPILKTGFELWRGCFASVRPSTNKLLLNLDIAHAVMYPSGDLPDVAQKLLGLGSNDIRRLRNPNFVPELQKLLKGVRVRQIKAGKVGRVRSIKKVIKEAGEYEFTLGTGERITVQEYFVRFHRYHLVDPFIPGILVEKKDSEGNVKSEDVIPFELLYVDEGQLYRRKLDPAVMASVQAEATKNPETRKRIIEQNLDGFTPQALASLGLHVDRHLISIKGRILPKPGIVCGPDRQTINLDKDNVASWDVYKGARQVQRPAKICAMAVLNYGRAVHVDDSRVKGFLALLYNCMDRSGMIHHQDQDLRNILIYHESEQGDPKRHVQNIVTREAKKRNIQLPSEELLKFLEGFVLLVILPSAPSFLYKTIKEIGDTGNGLITQGMFWGKKEDKSNAYVYNLLLKINAKAGGVNFSPIRSQLDWISEEPVMIIGADTTHAEPGVVKPSVAALVASMDPGAAKYFAATSHQRPRQESIEKMREMLLQLLRLFYERNQRLPFRFVVYRDGLSEGEIQNVCKKEIEEIRAAIRDAYVITNKEHKLSQVRITYLVVAKRHHIRFFPDKGYEDRSGNCKGGFIVDNSDLCRPRVWDFFLQSQTGRLGTSRPAHYTVVIDENKLASDKLQGITYGLCHAYCRSTSAVSIPAPVYYAHLVARRADIHLCYIGGDSAPSVASQELNQYNDSDWKFKDTCTFQKNKMYFV